MATVSCKQALIDQWENIISDVYKDIMKVIFSLYLWKSRKQRIYGSFFLFCYVFTLKVVQLINQSGNLWNLIMCS